MRKKLSVPIELEKALDNETFKLITKPMSNFEVMDFLGDGTMCRMYSEIKEMSHIDEALAPTGRCVFMYESEPNFGHWCCMFKRRGKAGVDAEREALATNGEERTERATIEVFDSYGFVPDDELKLVHQTFRYESGQEKRYLTRLLYNSGYQVHYNDYVLQGKGTATCGRHCIVRLQNPDLSADAYARKIERICKREKITPDEYVCRIVTI